MPGFVNDLKVAPRSFFLPLSPVFQDLNIKALDITTNLQEKTTQENLSLRGSHPLIQEDNKNPEIC